MFTLKRQKNKILNYHIKLNWKVILFFAIFWIAITLVICSFSFFGSAVHNNQIRAPYIGGYEVNRGIGDPSDSTTATSSPLVLGNLLTFGLYGAPGIVFFLDCNDCFKY